MTLHTKPAVYSTCCFAIGFSLQDPLYSASDWLLLEASLTCLAMLLGGNTTNRLERYTQKGTQETGRSELD